MAQPARSSSFSVYTPKYTQLPRQLHVELLTDSVTLSERIEALEQPIAAHAHLAAAQTGVLVNTITPVVWTSVDSDPHDMLTQGSANIVIPESGLFDISIPMIWDSNLGTKTVSLYADGSLLEYVTYGAVIPSPFTVLGLSLDEGAILEVRVLHNSGTRSIASARLTIRKSGSPF